MAVIEVQCPQYGSCAVMSYGRQTNGEQRYRCNNLDCERAIFLLQYQDKGRLPEVKRQSVEMALTDLTPREFSVVLPAFTRAYTEQYPADRTMTGEPRKCQAGGGRKGVLQESEQRLLFTLVH